MLRRPEGQQITFQIILISLDMICLAINYHLIITATVTLWVLAVASYTEHCVFEFQPWQT